MPTALLLLMDGFEELELIAPLDVLRRAGVTCRTAALAEGMHVTGRNGVTLHADTTLTAALAEAPPYDLVFLPGGPGVKALRADPRVRSVVQNQAGSGRWLAAICAAPTVLHDAGVLENRRYTAHDSVASELPRLDPSQTVVCDGNVLTSRGAGTALEFGLVLVEKLLSPAAAGDVARSIGAGR